MCVMQPVISSPAANTRATVAKINAILNELSQESGPESHADDPIDGEKFLISEDGCVLTYIRTGEDEIVRIETELKLDLKTLSGFYTKYGERTHTLDIEFLPAQPVVTRWIINQAVNQAKAKGRFKDKTTQGITDSY